MPITAIADRIARIATKAQVRGIQLGPRLGENELRRFEGLHGISLPEGFRAFLVHIGNGGDGPPAYGFAALGEAADDMRGEEVWTWSELPFVRELFPFTKPWVWEAGEKSNEGSIDQIHHGCIYVGNDGCGMYWYLIVTGPERGNVWMICGEGMQPTVPKRDFLQWYEDWLDGVQEWWA